MNKQEKLGKLLSSLNELELLEQRILNENSKLHNVIYADLGLNKLFGNKIKVQGFREKLKEAKITRAAKNLTIGINEDISLLFSNLALSIVEKVSQLNKTSSL